MAFAFHLASKLAIPDRPAWLWVQDKTSIRRNGRPFVHGLAPALGNSLIHVAAQRAEDAMFAIEEGVRCRDFAFVIGELAGDPKAFDFTASRRLSMASERHGVPLLLIRHDGFANLSAARRRWRIAASPSQTHPWNERAPGSPHWRANLFRARDVAVGEWVVGDHMEDNHGAATHNGDLAATIGHQPLAAQRIA